LLFGQETVAWSDAQGTLTLPKQLAAARGGTSKDISEGAVTGKRRFERGDLRGWGEAECRESQIKSSSV